MNIKDIAKGYVQITKQLEELKIKGDAYKLKLQNYFDAKNTNTISVEVDSIDGKGMYKLLKIEGVYINYFAEKLKAKLNKKVYAKIIQKKYEVNNMQGLINMLKEYDVPPAEFKNFINVIEIPDKEQIKQLYAIGEITREDLKGTFEAKIKKSIRVNLVKED